MPTANERIPNRLISTSELKQMLLQDFEMMLSRDGLLASTIGFGRVSYDITCKVHLDNPVFPEHIMQVQSKLNNNTPEVQPHPLPNPTQDSAVSAKKLTRKIDKPNVERVRRGMDVPVMTRNTNTGKVEEHGIKYDASILPEEDKGDGDVSVVELPENSNDPKWGL